MKMSETATKLSVKASTARRITANCLLRDARNTSALRSTAEEGWGATGRKKGEERACGGRAADLEVSAMSSQVRAVSRIAARQSTAEPPSRK